MRSHIGCEGLHLELELACTKYHLRDVILAKIMFHTLRNIRPCRMELLLLRREVYGTGVNQQVDNVVVARFEVLDGEPECGEMIPLRFYLGSSELTPTYRAVQNRFTVKYLLSFNLTDDRGKRYVKQ